jgi:predicted GIY-YIG superfamily endonuclease
MIRQRGRPVKAGGVAMLRDKLLARLRSMGADPDYQRLAADVLGIRNAPSDLARRLVQQALVVEDRREAWRRAGERICRDAPATPGVYVLRDADGAALYVGKAVNLRRRLRAHFAERRWRAIKPEFARIVEAEWTEVGSELEALLREAALIEELQPAVNVQIGAPALDTREIPRALVRDVLVIVRSVEADSVELVGARADGGWMIQRTRRSGADLAVHAQRVMRFFHSVLPPRHRSAPLAPIVFSWLARRGSAATRLNPHDARNARELRERLAVLLRDERLFADRLSLGDGA